MLRLLTVIALALLAGPALAEPPDWIVAAGGCKVWNDDPKPNKKAIWTGKCVEGLAEGHGVVQWSLDDKPWGLDEGEYRRGKLSGHGVMARADGNRYEGEWRDGKKHGRGVLIYDGGSRYEGQFAEGEPWGTGTLQWLSGSRYQGGWRAGKPDGHGTYRTVDGQTYSGNFVNGCFSQGTFRAFIGTTMKDCGF